MELRFSMKDEQFFKKISFESLRKNDSLKQCHFKDFQPLLEYSSWHLFQEIVGTLIKGCKKSLRFAKFIMLDHGFTREWEDSLPSILARTVAAQKKSKMPRVTPFKEDKDPLHDLFAHRRNYSIVPKD